MKRIAILAAAVAATSLSFAAAMPAAAAAPVDSVSVEVRYDDLDITSPAGAKVLDQRVKTGVELACQRPDMRDLKRNSAWQECKDAALEQAAEQLASRGMPTVTIG